ncbi:hypothetical protein [Flavobacterium bizetiae]|uniref:hypothetical protein n=1 Tax=Flavobacterium bizetiae TaxID=2704140 RepID=UPI00375788BD
MKKKIFVNFLVLITLISSCNKNYTLQKTVKGKIVNNNLAIKDVSIKYESTNVLSPQNVKTDKNGFFIMPKIEIRGYKEFISRQKEINSQMIINKSNYKTIRINIDKYDKGHDTIDLGFIYLRELKNINSKE